jgi:hypothetical protein
MKKTTRTRKRSSSGRSVRAAGRELLPFRNRDLRRCSCHPCLAVEGGAPTPS